MLTVAGDGNRAELRAIVKVRCKSAPLAEQVIQSCLSAERLAEVLSGEPGADGNALAVIWVLNDQACGVSPLPVPGDLGQLPSDLPGTLRWAFQRRVANEESYQVARDLPTPCKS